MLQDIFPHKFDNAFAIKEPVDTDYVLAFYGAEVLLDTNSENPSIPRCKTLKAVAPALCTDLIYLFSLDENNFFLSLNPPVLKETPLHKRNVSIFRSLQPAWLAFAGITGYHLYTWYDSHRFCGKCANPMEQSTTERALYCPCCRNIEYPKISPAIIVGVTDGDRILVSRYANREYKNYALLAGFAEIGETLEETVHREVMEEVGLNVDNIRYFKNQPWAFSQSLLIGFFADLAGANTLKIDENELAEAQWLHRDELPHDNSKISLTSEMIEAFRNNVHDAGCNR